MIKLKRLISENAIDGDLPDPSLKPYLQEHRVVSISEWLYHGSPYEGLEGMLLRGIYGTEHGEVAEHDSFSTSLNSEMLHHFSEGNGVTGLQFTVKDAKVIVLDNILSYLVTQLPGSGLDIEIDDQEAFEAFCKQFKIPTSRYTRGDYCLPWNYLSSLGVDAFVYDYVWDRMKRGISYDSRDESEICFIGNGISKLNQSISLIYVDGNEYEPEQKEEALRDIKSRI